MRRSLNGAAAALLAATAVMAWPDPPAPAVAIKDARIVTGAGPVIEKGTVVMKGGLIVEASSTAQVPPGAWVINGAGLTVYPGLIDGLSTWGIPQAAAPGTPAASGQAAQAQQRQQAAGPRSSGPEDRPQTTSWVKAADLVSLTDRRIDTARSAGFTTAVSFPKEGIVAGHGAVINLGGERAGEMVVDGSAGMYIALRSGGGRGFPSSLMGVISYLRQLWMDADWYRGAKEMYERNPQLNPRPEYDRALEGVMGTRRVLLPATTRTELERMAAFAGEFKQPVVLYGAHEAFRCIGSLKKAGVSVIVNVKWPVKQRDADPEQEDSYRTMETRDKAPASLIELSKAGIEFAFTSDGLDSPKELVRALKKPITAGLTKEAALRALTLGAAKIYGVDNRLGSIEPGKIANLTVVKGDLFDESSEVEMVFIDGKKYEPAPDVPSPPGGAPGQQRRPAQESGEKAGLEVKQ